MNKIDDIFRKRLEKLDRSPSKEQLDSLEQYIKRKKAISRYLIPGGILISVLIISVILKYSVTVKEKSNFIESNIELDEEEIRFDKSVELYKIIEINTKKEKLFSKLNSSSRKDSIVTNLQIDEPTTQKISSAPLKNKSQYYQLNKLSFDHLELKYRSFGFGEIPSETKLSILFLDSLLINEPRFEKQSLSKRGITLLSSSISISSQNKLSSDFSQNQPNYGNFKGYTAGLNLYAYSSENIKFKTGLLYSRYEQQVNLTYRETSDKLGQEFDHIVKSTNSYSYLIVPLAITYQMGKSKLIYYGESGLRAAFNLQADGFYIRNSNRNVLVNINEEGSKSRKNFLQAYLSLGFQYSLMKNIKLDCSIGLSKSVGPILDGLNYRPTINEFQLGLTFPVTLSK